jgi:hypothetical protein
MLTNTKLIKDIIDKSGYKYRFIAAKLNISYQALRNKLDNKSEFLPTEIEKLCNLLSITDLKLKNDIFFASFVE